MTDLSLSLQGEGRLIGPARLEVGVVGGPLGVHQVKVKIVHAAGGQLDFKEGPDVRLRFEEVVCQLIRQDIAVPGIAAGKALLQGRFALALQIAAGRVEVVEPCFQKRIHHPLGFRDVHIFSLHGQAHTSKAKISFDPVHHIRSFFQFSGRRWGSGRILILLFYFTRLIPPRQLCSGCKRRDGNAVPPLCIIFSAS